jgi:hypothetical protein
MQKKFRIDFILITRLIFHAARHYISKFFIIYCCVSLFDLIAVCPFLVLIGLIFSLFVSGIAREAAKTIQTHPLCQVPSAEQKQMEESSHKTKRTKKSTTLRDVCLARRRDRKLD